MNWFVNVDSSQVKDEDDRCVHVEAGEPIFRITREMDSFGPVAGYAVCKACAEEAQKAEEEEEVFCNDCEQMVKAGDTIQWKWFDFYPPQGDEPLTICNECKVKEKHCNRVAKNRADAHYAYGDDGYYE